MMISVDRSDSRPLYEQIYCQLKREICDGNYEEGKALKPVRVFASLIGVSRNTVDLAYKQLLAEGYIYSRPGSGYYVEKKDRYSPDGYANRMAASVSVNNASNALHHSADVGKIIYDFAYEHVDSAELEWKKWKKCVDETLYAEEYSFEGYENCKGDIELRHTINRYIYEHRGVKCDDSQIVICSGTLYAIDIAIALIQHADSRQTQAGDIQSVLCHEQNEPSIMQLFRNHDYVADNTAFSINKGNEPGCQTSHGNSCGTDIIYCSPSHMHLLGTAMDEKERLSCLGYAAEKNIYIIENDCDSEFVYGRQRIGCIQSMETDSHKKRVIYISSVSRILSPTIRIAYMVLPYDLVHIYEKMYSGFRTAVSVLHQRTLSLYIRKGYMDKHIRKLLRSSKSKYQTLRLRLDSAVSQGLIQLPGEPAGGYIAIKYINEYGQGFGDYAQGNGVRLYSEGGLYKIGFLEMEEDRIALAADKLLKLMGDYGKLHP